MAPWPRSPWRWRERAANETGHATRRCHLRRGLPEVGLPGRPGCRILPRSDPWPLLTTANRNPQVETTMSDFELVWDSRCGVAECPTWDAATRRLLFADIPGKQIHALHVDTG